MSERSDQPAAQTLRAITPTGDPLGRISIPRLRASFVFVQGTDSAALRGGPGHYMPTALPGEHGTVGLAGHRTTYLQPFRHIDRLRAGDRITLTMPYGRFSYVVSGSRVVAPSELSVLARTPGVDRLVLTACHPLFSAAQRLVVTARLASTSA